MVRTCEVCKCTDLHACRDGCAWVDPTYDLCSTCAETVVGIQRWISLAVSPNLKRLVQAAVDPRFGAPEVTPANQVALEALHRGITDEASRPEIAIIVDLDQLRRTCQPAR